MQLLRDLGPARAGSFAFVSPIIAVLVGVIAAGETVSALSVAGMAVMLVAAGACLYGDELKALFARIACNGVGTAPKTRSSSTLS
jgi:drug/metabolite transporter (DMT)-like permease